MRTCGPAGTGDVDPEGVYCTFVPGETADALRPDGG